jgi:hypothetical protein
MNNRLIADARRAPIGQAAEGEHDGHGVLAADEVGDPAEERARQPVQDVVDDQRTAERGP